MKKKILIIEDTESTLDLLKWRAERNEFEYSVDDTGAGWQEAVALQKPDAVLLDMNLPLMSGFGVLREFQHRPELAGIPVFILSSVSDPEVKEEAFSLGAVDYFEKHEDIDTIFQKLHSYIDNKKTDFSSKESSPAFYAS